MKIIIFSIILVFVVVQGADAQRIASPSADRGQAQKAANQQARLTSRLESLRERALREIDRRLASLNKLSTRIDSLKRLSTGQKSSFKAGIQGQIDSLTSLRGTIETQTDAATLRSDVKSIRDSYRIYALYMPKIGTLVVIDVMNTTYNKLSELATKLDTRIQEAKAEGNDTTVLETALTDMKSDLESAKTNFTEAEQLVLPLEPEGFPGNKTQLQEARTKMQAARADFRSARENARTIIQGLKGFNKQPTATATPTL